MPEYLYTKDQLLHVLAAWDVKEPIPGKSKQIIINFPPGSIFSLGRVELSDKRSTYGKRLYRVRLGNTTESVGLKVVEVSELCAVPDCGLAAVTKASISINNQLKRPVFLCKAHADAAKEDEPNSGSSIDSHHGRVQDQ